MNLFILEFNLLHSCTYTERPLKICEDIIFRRLSVRKYFISCWYELPLCHAVLMNLTTKPCMFGKRTRVCNTNIMCLYNLTVSHGGWQWAEPFFNILCNAQPTDQRQYSIQSVPVPAWPSCKQPSVTQEPKLKPTKRIFLWVRKRIHCLITVGSFSVCGFNSWMFQHKLQTVSKVRHYILLLE